MTSPNTIIADLTAEVEAERNRRFEGNRESSAEIARMSKELAKVTRQRDDLLFDFERIGHAAGCRKNAFGDICTCGITAAIARAKGE